MSFSTPSPIKYFTPQSYCANPNALAPESDAVRRCSCGARGFWPLSTFAGLSRRMEGSAGAGESMACHGVASERSETRRRVNHPCSHIVGGYKARERRKAFGFAALVDPGSYLLSRDLSSDYHRRTNVSLPGSGWDRVGPLGCDHQASTGGWVVPAACLMIFAGFLYYIVQRTGP